MKAIEGFLARKVSKVARSLVQEEVEEVGREGVCVLLGKEVRGSLS